MNDKTLAILAGGQSSRMNHRNKALMTYQDKTFIERLIEAGEDFEEVIIIANDPTPYQLLNVRVILIFLKVMAHYQGLRLPCMKPKQPTFYVWLVICH